MHSHRYIVAPSLYLITTLQHVIDLRDEIEEAALTFIMKETQNLQRAVYNGHLTDSKDVLDYLMERDQIMPRLNDRVLSSGEANNSFPFFS